jgi:hypothetical protein
MDYGDSWTKINNLPLTQFYDIEIDYMTPDRLYGGTQDNSTIRTWTGALDDWEVILGGDGFYTIVDYTNSNIIYAEYQYGQLFKSTNGGSYFNYLADFWGNDRTNWSSPVFIHPTNPEILYFGTYRIWKTTNSGDYWTAVSGDLTDGDDGSGYHTITTIAVSSLSSNIVVAGTDDGNVHISTDDGDTWTDITDGLPDRWITRVACDPFELNTIYCTVSGFRWDEPLPHVFKSNDLGQNWIDISANLPELPMNCIALDPQVPDRIFVGSDAGMFYSENGGGEWSSLSDGLPNVPIIAMKIHDPTRKLVIGTYGCSSFELDLNELTNTEGELVLSPVKLHQNYPNPFNPSTTISFDLNQNVKSAEVEIFNVKGQKVKTLHVNDPVKGKTNSVIWNGNDENDEPAASGVYLYRVLLDKKSVASGKMSLVK